MGVRLSWVQKVRVIWRVQRSVRERKEQRSRISSCWPPLQAEEEYQSWWGPGCPAREVFLAYLWASIFKYFRFGGKTTTTTTNNDNQPVINPPAWHLCRCTVPCSLLFAFALQKKCCWSCKVSRVRITLPCCGLIGTFWEPLQYRWGNICLHLNRSETQWFWLIATVPDN